MPHLMPYQKVIDGVRSSLPDRKDQQTFIYVKACGTNLTMLYGEVLSSKEFGKSTLDFLVDHGVLCLFDLSIALSSRCGDTTVPLWLLSQSRII